MLGTKLIITLMFGTKLIIILMLGTKLIIITHVRQLINLPFVGKSRRAVGK